MQNSGPTERTVAFSRLKLANKCVCGRGFAPDPAGGACSAPPDPLAGLRGPVSKGRGRGGVWDGRGAERKREEKERGGGMPHLSKGDRRPCTALTAAFCFIVRLERQTCRGASKCNRLRARPSF